MALWGQDNLLFCLSGGDDQVVKFWEVCTGRCLKTLQCGGTVHSMAWNPNPSLTLLAIAV